MKFKWEYQNRLDAKDHRPWASLALNIIGSEGRRSFVGSVYRDHKHPGMWCVLIHELNDYLFDLEYSNFTSRLSAMRELRKRFIVAWIGATHEERDDVWD